MVAQESKNRRRRKGVNPVKSVRAFTVKRTPAELVRTAKAAGILQDKSWETVVEEALELWVRKANRSLPERGL